MFIYHLSHEANVMSLTYKNLFKVSDYLEVVKKPMDLEKIREKIDCMEYDTVK